MIIVPCTQEKIWDSTPNAGAVAAKDAYTKPAFGAWRAFAEQSGSPWFILSTKYGLLHPDTEITRYNVPISVALSDPTFFDRLAEQGRRLGLNKSQRVVLLDWERFQPLVRAAVGDAQVPCVLHRLQY